MTNVITAILDMDRQARLTVETAHTRASKIMSDAQQKKERMEQDSREDTKAQTAKRFEAVKSASDREIARIEKRADEKCVRLSEKMSAGREKWKKEILSKITGENETP